MLIFLALELIIYLRIAEDLERSLRFGYEEVI